MATQPEPQKPITKEDLEEKFKAFQGEVQNRVDDKKSTIVGVAVGVGAAVLLIVFLLGKRAGKKKTAIVEIRRV